MVLLLTTLLILREFGNGEIPGWCPQPVRCSYDHRDGYSERKNRSTEEKRKKEKTGRKQERKEG